MNCDSFVLSLETNDIISDLKKNLREGLFDLSQIDSAPPSGIFCNGKSIT